MSQRAVEAVLGRLITDVEFRTRFFVDPTEVCRENDVVLTERETSALLQVSVPALHGLTARLDPKIVRAAVGAVGHSADRVKGSEMRAERLDPPPVPGLRRE